MIVPVFDHRIAFAQIIRRRKTNPHSCCECCGDEPRYLRICDGLYLCWDCAKNYKRLGMTRFLETYWMPFNDPDFHLTPVDRRENKK